MDLEQDLCSEEPFGSKVEENLQISLFLSEIAFLGATFYSVINRSIDKFSYILDWHSYFNY